MEEISVIFICEVALYALSPKLLSSLDFEAPGASWYLESVVGSVLRLCFGR